MKRNYYPNSKIFPKRPNSKTTKEQMAQKPKPVNRICCMECGTSHGTMHKVKKNDGTKGYLCEYCFEDYRTET